MSKRHEFPAIKPSGILIESPGPRQDTDDFIWTLELNLDIAPTLMRDPHPRRDMFKRFKVVVIQHVARVGKDCPDSFIGYDGTLGRFWRRRRLLFRLVLTSFSQWRIIGRALIRLRSILRGAGALLILSLSGYRRVVGQHLSRRVEPCLRLDRLESFCVLDKETGVNHAKAVYLSVQLELQRKWDLHL